MKFKNIALEGAARPNTVPAHYGGQPLANEAHENSVRLIDLVMKAGGDASSISDEDKREYYLLREFFLRDERYKDCLPTQVFDSASLLGLAQQTYKQTLDVDARRRRLFQEFAPLMETIDRELRIENPSEASDWTGLDTRVKRLTVLRDMIPVVRLAINSLIETLEHEGGNGGPLLDDRLRAIEQLQLLHSTLGEILDSIERGSFDDGLGEGAAAEAVRYAKRAANLLKGDPIPYAMSGLLLSTFASCGFPEAGAWLSAAALTVNKPASTPKGPR